MNDNTFRVQVARRGTLTLPRELGEHNHIETGDTLTLSDLGHSVVARSAQRTRVDMIATELAKEGQESGETLESMLRTLRKVRAEHGSQGSQGAPGYQHPLLPIEISRLGDLLKSLKEDFTLL